MLIPARVLYIGRFAHQLDERHLCCQLINVYRAFVKLQLAKN